MTPTELDLPERAGRVWKKCVAAGHNGGGDPDLWFAWLWFNADDLDDEKCCRAIHSVMELSSFDAQVVATEDDPMGAACQLAVWESMSAWDVADPDNPVLFRNTASQK